MLENVKVLCHSAVKITGEKILYFDPFKIGTEMHDADMIFITHDHYDHFSPEDISVIIKEDTLLIAPLSIKEAVSKAGYGNVLYINPGETKTFSDSSMEISAIRSYNPGKQFHPAEKNYVGYVVKMDETVYYVAGDTDITEEALNVTCDAAIVPVGGKYTMNASEAAELVNRIKPKYAVPTHYGSVVGNADDGEKFASLTAPEIQVLFCK